MRSQDPRVPAEVEEYLIGVYAAAGELGDRINASIGVRGSARGAGARGGVIGARMLKTTVAERSGVATGTPEEVLARLARSIPNAHELTCESNLLRIEVPIGPTGLQHVVVDLVLTPSGADAASPSTEVRLRAYCKEGLLYRKRTAATADELWTSIAS